MHRVDPGGGVINEFLAGGDSGNAADDGVDEVEIQHRVVRAEAEGGVGDGRGHVGRVAGGGLCRRRRRGLGEGRDGGGEKEEKKREGGFGEGQVHGVKMGQVGRDQERMWRSEILQTLRWQPLLPRSRRWPIYPVMETRGEGVCQLLMIGHRRLAQHCDRKSGMFIQMVTHSHILRALESKQKVEGRLGRSHARNGPHRRCSWRTLCKNRGLLVLIGLFRLRSCTTVVDRREDLRL